MTTWGIYTSGWVGWDYMLGGFNSAREAMAWLTKTYQPDAEFWMVIKAFKIEQEKV